MQRYIVRPLFITDIEDPIIQCPANRYVNTNVNEATAVAVWAEPVASDNSGKSPNVSCSMESGTQFVIGQTEVICQARDGSGNQANCNFTVEVKGKIMEYFTI